MSKNHTIIVNDKKKPNKLANMTSCLEQSLVLDVLDPESKTVIQTTSEALKKSYYNPPEKTSVNVVYQVVYPDDLNLKPAPGSQKTKNRVGRPKKSKVTQPAVGSPAPAQKAKVKVVSKTRSGREVKFPKYIQNDFKKIEIDDDNSPNGVNDCDIKTSDFVKYTEKDKEKEEPKMDPKLLSLDSLQKKRRIAAQYRCPKCQKAYLGRNKILEHLKKNPSHGPMHQSEQNHFEVWNYLVSITQKCPSSERGPKFCQELSNLLHNLLLLTNALFKKLGSAANEVKIDKVLGNAIGLSPGTYYFDDNNLYKDVTVLQLMANSDFLNSIRSSNIKAPEASNCNCGKLNTIDELVLKSMLISSEANDSIAKKIDGIKIDKQIAGDDFFVSTNLSLNDYEMKSDDLESLNQKKHFPEMFSFDPNNFSTLSNDKPKTPKIKIHSNILICPPSTKQPQSDVSVQKNSISPELLTDNSVLLPIPNLPHTVDELMLPVSIPGSILDNSSSSDEVMNVDQFVNERFRKITESDLEVSNSNSLNLDLPALDMFQFHTT